jgi:hypothetical protein
MAAVALAVRAKRAAAKSGMSPTPRSAALVEPAEVK